MTFKRLLGIGIFTIIYGLGAVGWADIKPINPSVDCKQYVAQPAALMTYLANYKSNATLIDGRYVFCFDSTEPQKFPLSFQNLGSDVLVIYGLKIKSDPTYLGGWAGKTLLTVTGNNVLLQNVQFTGLGNVIVGSVGVALSGSNLSIINSTITGFEIGVKADCSTGCAIGSKNVIDNVKQGVVLPATSQGVTITQNELRTTNDPYGTTQKIVLQGLANGGLTPPTFITDPATKTIWKTLSDDKVFVTEIGGVLPKTGTIELFEHHPDKDKNPDGSYKYTDYFRASCSTTQNDKGLWEFKCTGLNIDAAKGQVFTNVTYAPNTSAMTKWIDVKDIPEKIYTTAVNPGATISGGSLSDPSSAPPAGDGGLVVGGAGETVAMNDGGPSGGGMSPPPDIKIDDASDGGSAAAMTGGSMALAGDGAPSAGGAASGCGGQLMPEKTPVDSTLFVILLMPIVILLQVRWNKGG